ncbi:MAG: hypothetical protein OXJ52_08745 [Oligoflexia bacterium]|nr:hypothetical protein [Oligoflexia bacterium]
MLEPENSKRSVYSDLVWKFRFQLDSRFRGNDKGNGKFKQDTIY